ncbi:hypothetical protein [Bordetella genomosp. 11]|uniref:Uncharacterized protein n=1 Tax=Bordetella genomosp. 11 TaxID=1416808 RepID=A0A261UIF9_9BORD|nr:hypothetical protein [Bordetella genomosp. 11]OZI61708.1 hypothetical protein CAL28_20855 [Bordetella genomosp. 11]
MPYPTSYQTYKQRELQAMMASRHRDPAYMERQRKTFDAVLAMMQAALGGLDVASRECHAVGGFTIEEANKWLDLFEQIAPIVLQIPFGYGPVKGVPVLALKGAAAAGVNFPRIGKVVNNAVEVSGATAVVMTPMGWVDKISQAFAVTGYAHGAATYGSHFATPLGVKTALSPTLANLLNQIAHWTSNSASGFSQFAATFASMGSVFAHLMATLKVALSYSRLDGIQSVLDHYPDCDCQCHQYTRELVNMSMNPAMDAAMGLNVITAPIPAWNMMHKKAHAVANKFRGPEQRTHRHPYEVATGLLKGARQPSMNHGCRTARGAAGGRCPVALLTIATLFGNGDPAKGYKAAVAAVQANIVAGATRLKDKIG